MAGEACRDAEGNVCAPCTEHRLRRVLHARDWQKNRIEGERERLEGILSAVEARGNAFARLGDLWLVSFEGRRAFVPDCAGMPYIHKILEQAASDGGLTPGELCKATHAPPPEMLPDENKPREVARDDEGGFEQTGTTEADRNAIDNADEQLRRRYMADPEARAKVAELKRELRTAPKERKAIIQKTLALLGEGDPRRKRRAPDPEKEKERKRVAAAIRRALDDIAT